MSISSARFSEAINAIIDAVDSDAFPASVAPESSIHNILADAVLDKCTLVSEALETTEGKLASARFYKVHRKINRFVPEIDDIKPVIVEMQNAAEFVPLAVGFAAGLRAAGASKQQARMMLAGYLRNFRED